MRHMRIIIIWVFFSFSIFDVFSQTQSNLLTPKGSTVVAYIVPEMSDSEREYWDSYYTSPSRILITTSNN